jgi:hypothetical protein
MQMHPFCCGGKPATAILNSQYKGKRIYWKAFAYAEGTSAVIFAIGSAFLQNVAKSAEILKARPLSAPPNQWLFWTISSLFLDFL